MQNFRLGQLILPAIILVTTAGCGRTAKVDKQPDLQGDTSALSNNASVVVETPPDFGAPPPTTPSLPPTGEITQQNAASVLNTLTQSVRKFTVERQHLPKTLEEVVRDGYIPGLPSPPGGKKFALDLKTVRVVLVQQ